MRTVILYRMISGSRVYNHYHMDLSSSHNLSFIIESAVAAAECMFLPPLHTQKVDSKQNSTLTVLREITSSPNGNSRSHERQQVKSSTYFEKVSSKKFRCSRALDSVVCGQVWQKFKLIQDIMTCPCYLPV